MDPIGNLLTTLKNASLARKGSIVSPYSKFKMAVLDVLKREGYVKAVNVIEKDNKKFVEVALAYEKDKPKITGVVRKSLPSRRVYIGVKKITPVKYGTGLLILSTPKGILTDKEARKELVGGEVLFTIW